VSAPHEKDPTVERLKSARDNAVVLKLELIKLRSRCPAITIFVVEGDEDKSVYSQWIRLVRLELRHEYFVTRGKRQALGLYQSVERDVTGLRNGIYFLIDRDFDDLTGVAPGPSIFMTDRYSVENYIVSDEVVDEILKIEMSCNGYPAVREAIKQLFADVYGQFLRETREINLRLFLGKKIPLKRVGSLPVSISHIAVVSLRRVSSQVRLPSELIQLEREPTEEEARAIREAFDELDPAHRYRGKFAMLFFKRWIDLLVDDYASAESQFFAEIDARARARQHEIVLSSLAARSPLPIGFAEFISAI
jgi:hypothetical protein